jgi:hypothetical protein
MIPPHSRHLLTPSGTAFHFTEQPPADVGSSHHLAGDEPDAAICAVLARAQQGDFSHIRQIIRLMKEHDSAWVWSHCSGLLAYAGSADDFRLLVATFNREIANQDGATIEWIIEILAESTLLWTVPHIIDYHRRMLPDDRLRYCGAVERLSFMLEAEQGDVAKGPEDLLLNPNHEFWEDDDWSLDFPPYEAMLLDQAKQLESRLPPGAWAVFRNEPLSLPKIAELALSKVQRNRDCEILATARMLLEAYTGRDMRGFYRLEDYKLDPLAAGAMLEDMLESGELERFEPGVRYFFGHRIPD